MTTSCEICGKPTWSKYGICVGNPGCRTANLQKRFGIQRQATRDIAKRSYKKRRHESPEFFLLKNARRRARERGLSFAITVGDIHVPIVCPVLGIELSLGVGASHNASPTLDRIVPELGYVKGNVEVISYKANSMKRDATLEELASFIRYYGSKIQELTGEY